MGARAALRPALEAVMPGEITREQCSRFRERCSRKHEKVVGSRSSRLMTCRRRPEKAGACRLALAVNEVDIDEQQRWAMIRSWDGTICPSNLRETSRAPSVAWRISTAPRWTRPRSLETWYCDRERMYSATEHPGVSDRRYEVAPLDELAAAASATSRLSTRPRSASWGVTSMAARSVSRVPANRSMAAR